MGANAASVVAATRNGTGRLGFVFWVELVYLVLLFAVGLIYVTPLNTQLPFKVPGSLGPVPVGVPWFGALGAVLISLSGVFDHRGDWNPDLRYWHFSRPLIGAALGLVSVLVFQAGILAVNSEPHPTGGMANLLYYLVAFLVGYREETFRELIKRLGDVILTPGGGPAPPVVRELRPGNGPAGGGTDVLIFGSGFTGATDVMFGRIRAKTFTVDSDGQITAKSPPADAPGQVAITVTTKQGSGTGALFTYEGQQA